MKRFCLVVAVASILTVFSQPAFADDYDDCRTGCSKDYTDCITQADQYVNDIEVKDAKAVCDKTVSDCNAVCIDKEQNHGFDKPAPKQTEEDANPKTN